MHSNKAERLDLFMAILKCQATYSIYIVLKSILALDIFFYLLCKCILVELYCIFQLPEVTHAGEEEAKLSGHHVGVFLLQNLGLLSGYGIILLLTLVTGNIDFESV